MAHSSRQPASIADLTVATLDGSATVTTPPDGSARSPAVIQSEPVGPAVTQSEPAGGSGAVIQPEPGSTAITHITTSYSPTNSVPVIVKSAGAKQPALQSIKSIKSMVTVARVHTAA